MVSVLCIIRICICILCKILYYVLCNPAPHCARAVFIFLLLSKISFGSLQKKKLAHSSCVTASYNLWWDFWAKLAPRGPDEPGLSPHLAPRHNVARSVGAVGYWNRPSRTNLLNIPNFFHPVYAHGNPSWWYPTARLIWLWYSRVSLLPSCNTFTLPKEINLMQHELEPSGPILWCISLRCRPILCGSIFETSFK